MPQTDPWTIGRLLKWTQDYLREHGVESPRLEAEILLAEARGCPRIALYTAFEEEPSPEVRTAFRELVRRRAEGTPVAYLVGRREFYSLSFRVSPDVLIPRPETEFLLIGLLDRAQARGAGQELRIADVGTGSGILAICAARRLPAARLTAIDISPAALAIAQANAADHQVAARIEFVTGDLLACLPAEARFEFIVSNPPYVRSDEMAGLPRDVREHEPRQALEAGPLGTEVIARLLPQAADRLTPGGELLLEISPPIEQDVRQLFAADGRFELQPTQKDLSGKPRVLAAQLRS